MYNIFRNEIQEITHMKCEWILARNKNFCLLEGTLCEMTKEKHRKVPSVISLCRCERRACSHSVSGVYECLHTVHVSLPIPSTIFAHYKINLQVKLWTGIVGCESRLGYQFSWWKFSSLSQGKWWNIISIRQRQLPFEFFLIHQPSYHPNILVCTLKPSLSKRNFCLALLHVPSTAVCQSQSQSYFTTGGLPPISSSCRQTPWGSRPSIFFNWTLAIIDLM
jgi:hypothetical protein